MIKWVLNLILTTHYFPLYLFAIFFLLFDVTFLLFLDVPRYIDIVITHELYDESTEFELSGDVSRGCVSIKDWIADENDRYSEENLFVSKFYTLFNFGCELFVNFLVDFLLDLFLLIINFYDIIDVDHYI